MPSSFTSRSIASILSDKLIDAKLQPAEHHPAIARTSAPPNGFRLKNDNRSATFCQRQRSREPSESRSNNGDVNLLRQSLRTRNRHLNRSKPVVEFPSQSFGSLFLRVP